MCLDWILGAEGQCASGDKTPPSKSVFFEKAIFRVFFKLKKMGAIWPKL